MVKNFRQCENHDSWTITVDESKQTDETYKHSRDRMPVCSFLIVFLIGLY